MDFDCCGQTADGQEGRLHLASSLLVGSLVSAALLAFLSGRRDGRRPDQCRSLDCTRCHGWAAAARLAAARLAAAGERAGSARVRAALADWLAGTDGRLLVAGLSERPWWDGALGDDTRRLRDAWHEVAAEYEWARRRPAAWAVNDTPAGRWRVFWIVNQGVARDVCPRTRTAVARLAAAMPSTVFSNVCFSVLEPGTRIEPHTGPTNVRIRCHLGLETPDGCRLVVDGAARGWRRGDCLLFDDSYLHHAEHPGPGDGPPRAVLMVDLWHPGLTPDERQLLAHVLRPAQLDV